MAEDAVDIETIDILLIGDGDEIAEAIRLIDTRFRKKIIEIIRRRALSANEHDLLDIYQHVLLSILQHAKEGNYDPDAQRLEAFIYTVAWRRSADWIRGKSRVMEEYNTDAIVQSTKEIISGSRYEEPWLKALSEERRNLILETVRRLIPKLKQRQRQVAEIIVYDFPRLLCLADIKKQIWERYGEDVTIVAVKRARQEVRDKVKEALSIAGYGEDIDD